MGDGRLGSDLDPDDNLAGGLCGDSDGAHAPVRLDVTPYLEEAPPSPTRLRFEASASAKAKKPKNVGGAASKGGGGVRPVARVAARGADGVSKRKAHPEAAGASPMGYSPAVRQPPLLLGKRKGPDPGSALGATPACWRFTRCLLRSRGLPKMRS